MFYFVDLLRTEAQDTASLIAVMDCSKDIAEKSGYIVFYEKVVKHQKIIASQKADVSN